MIQNLVVYDITNTAFSISNETMLNISSVDTRQPEYNLNKNCTAALGHRFHGKYSWIAIPCSKPFTVTYFCQSVLLLPDFNFRSDLNPFNSTCAEGWLMLARRPVCYLILKPDKAISFYEGEYECSSRNSSIYKPTISSEPKIDDTWLKTWFQMQHQTNSKQYTRNNVLRKLIFGTLLDNSHVENSLGQSVGMQLILAGVSDRCGIIESPHLQMTMKIGNRQLRSRWFYKYRPCSTPYNVNVLVCEKESNMYSHACSSLQFRCMDGTCVLSVYRCDGTDDCFDASDEIACSYKKTDKSPINGLPHSVECLLYFNCNETHGWHLAIHDVCDGIYTLQFPAEPKLCRKKQLDHMHIYSSVMTREIKKEEKKDFQLSSLIDLFIKENSILLYRNESYKSQKRINSDKTLNITQYLTECNVNGEHRSIDRMCKISAHIRPCHFHFVSVICLIIWCPGMFKCIYSYCIPMSLVCDGHYDCPDGEDELFCSKLVCPGLLKCRGENKCVSVGELCDGQVNCRFTSDDEITCTKCPPGCRCFYYVMTCRVTSHFTNILISSVNYIKALVVKGNLSNITIQDIAFYSVLIHLDISFCGLQNILISGALKVNSPHILFVEFTHNSLSQIIFLSTNIFSRVVYVDLSHNMISYINSRSLHMTYLQVLKIGNNDIQEIFMMFRKIGNELLIVDISHVNYTDKIKLHFDILNYKLIEVRVTDPALCCILNSRCKLGDGRSEPTCHRLIKKRVIKWTVYILTTITFATSNAQFLFILYKLSSYNKQAKYYNTIRINQSLTELCFVTYFISVTMGDILKINIIFLRKSVLCHIMNILFYVPFSTCIIFKAFSTIIISLKIKFPFKHQ